jgi:spore coat protein U-like protein
MSRLLLLAVFAPLLPAAAQAASCTASATAISFGTYVPSNASPINSTGTVSVTCSSGVLTTVSYTIALNTGLNAGGSFANRRMKNGTSLLSYQIYTSAARTTVWGDGTGGTSTMSDSYACTLACSGTKKSYNAYGQLPARQWTVAPGAYTDTITVTVTFN